MAKASEIQLSNNSKFMTLKDWEEGQIIYCQYVGTTSKDIMNKKTKKIEQALTHNVLVFKVRNDEIIEEEFEEKGISGCGRLNSIFGKMKSGDKVALKYGGKTAQGHSFQSASFE